MQHLFNTTEFQNPAYLDPYKLSSTRQLNPFRSTPINQHKLNKQTPLNKMYLFDPVLFHQIQS